MNYTSDSRQAVTRLLSFSSTINSEVDDAARPSQQLMKRSLCSVLLSSNFHYTLTPGEPAIYGGGSKNV